MFLDRTTLAARTWAIPSLSALLILHHDFKPPRFVNVSRLIWADNDVQIHLRYGLSNLSGQVTEATDLVLTLHRSGAVSTLSGAPVRDEQAAAQNKLQCFLTGEIARERIRREQDFAAWRSHEWIDEDVRSLFVFVTALVARPVADMRIEVVKPPSRPETVQRVRLHGERAVLTLEQYGDHGVTARVTTVGRSVPGLRMRQEYDVRTAWGPPPRDFVRSCKQLIGRAAAFLLLPLDLLLHVADYYLPDRTSPAAPLVDHLPPSSVVDSGIDDSLSAFSDR